MTEVVVSGTILLCAVLLIRFVLKDRLPAGLRYALWLVVAVRLLVPVNLGASVMSVANWTQGRAVQAEGNALRDMGTGGTDFSPGSAPVRNDEGTGAVPPVRNDEGTGAVPPVRNDEGVGVVLPGGQDEGILGSTPEGNDGGANGSAPIGQDGSTGTDWLRVVKGIWLTGAVGMALWFLVANLRLWGRLRRGRRPFPVGGCPVPVYRADFLPSPCLAGVIRPAIYLNQAAADHPERLRYILAHELCHKRHGDNGWALVRTACLCLWWFHPLVWVGAVCAKRDCEIFCDEAAVRRLGEAERIPYGRTLVEMVAAGRPGAGELLWASTAMTQGPKEIQERVSRVSQHRKMKKAAVALAVSLALVAGLCTFTGAVENATGTPVPYPVAPQAGLVAQDLEAGEMSIPDFAFVGNKAEYSREVAIRFMAEYGKRLYALPQGSPWLAADVAVLGTGYEWTGLPREAGDWGRETHRKGETAEIWETVALAVKPVGGLDAVRALYGGGLPRGTGEYEDYALMEFSCSLTLEDGRWYAHGNGAYSVALRMSATPPPESGNDWTDERLAGWRLNAERSVAVTGDDQAAWEEAGRLWAGDYVRQHLTALGDHPAKADNVELLAMELTGGSPTAEPSALYFHLKYAFRPVWGMKLANRFLSYTNNIGGSWDEGSDTITVTASVTLARAGTEDGKTLWQGYGVHGEYASNYERGMDISLPLPVVSTEGAQRRDIDPVGVAITFPAGTDEAGQRYAVLGLWAAEFGQQFYHLPQDHPLACDWVEVDHVPALTPAQITSTGEERQVLGVTAAVGLRLKPVNGQEGAAQALDSDRTYTFSPGTNQGRYDGLVSAEFQVTLERREKGDGSVTWTCTQGRPSQDSDWKKPPATQALTLPHHVEAKAGWSLPTLDPDLVYVPDDGKGDLDARWAAEFAKQFYALPHTAAWRAQDVMLYDAGRAIGIAIKPAGGLEALVGQFPEGFDCPVGKGELAGYALLQYNLTFRRETVNLFGEESVWVKSGGGRSWVPPVPPVDSEDWQQGMEDGWRGYLEGRYSYLSAREPGDPDQSARAWSETFLDGMRGDRLWWGTKIGSPLQADSAKILDITPPVTGQAEGEQSLTFTLRYALRPIWGLETARACLPSLRAGSGELGEYALGTATVELRYEPGRPAEEFGYPEQPGMWYCAGIQHG